MKYKTADEINNERIRLCRDYVEKNYKLVIYGIEKDLYHVICSHRGYFNTMCSICAQSCETGHFEIKENKNPVCQDCGLKYAVEEEVVEWKEKF